MRQSVSNARDRSDEFQSIAERLKKQAGPGPSSQSDPTPSPSSRLHQHTEFSQRASQMGLGIAKVSEKLNILTKLAKRTSVFDDPTKQINELTAIIKQDIQALNKGVAELQNVSNGQTSTNRQSTSHSHTVVDNLRARLKDTTTSFKGVLEMRKDTLKVHQERRNLYSASANAGDAVQPLLAATPMFGSADAAAPSSSQPGGAMHAPQQQQQQLLMQEDTYMSSRAEALQNVESTILELGNIFSQLSHLVQEQGELAIRIDENVDDTMANVDRAQGQLLKYLNTISSNRWLLMKIFGVLMAFFLFFVTFIA